MGNDFDTILGNIFGGVVFTFFLIVLGLLATKGCEQDGMKACYKDTQDVRCWKLEGVK